MTTTMRNALALIALALALAAPAHAQIYPGYGTPTLLGDGSVSAPSFSFASTPARGIYHDSAQGGLGFAIGGVEVFLVNASGIFVNSTALNVASNTQLGWSSTTSGFAASDAALKRIAAGQVGVTAGGSTAFANLSGVLLVEANNVTQSSVSQNLHSYSVPANVMTTNGKTLRVTALFLSVNNANAKAIGFTVCGGSLTFNATASIAGAYRAVAYIVRTAANTWTTSVVIEEGLSSGTLTSAKISGTYNSTPSCTDTATNTIAASVNTAGATDTSSGFFMVELLN